MCRGLLAIIDGLAAANADRVSLDLDIEVRLANTRNLDNRNDVVPLLEHVDRGIGAAGARPRTDPPTGTKAVESLLEPQQRLKWVCEYHSHNRSPFTIRYAVRPRAAALPNLCCAGPAATGRGTPAARMARVLDPGARRRRHVLRWDEDETAFEAIVSSERPRWARMLSLRKAERFRRSSPRPPLSNMENDSRCDTQMVPARRSI
jgi:hypothetical protein